jgi:endonuclease YncB( thermonuclease family)
MMNRRGFKKSLHLRFITVKKVGFLILLFILSVWWWGSANGVFSVVSPQEIFKESQIQQDKASIPVAEVAKVRFVIDGDTFILSDGRKVRLIGMDTPERWQPYYNEAKSHMMKLVFGKEVRLIKDTSETDKYGRLLRYVYIGDEFINLKLVEEGYARVLTVPPDVKYRDIFINAEQNARSKKLGLWKN